MFPTPWTVDVLPYLGGTKDAFGNEAPTWANTPRPEPVYGWAPAGTDEVNGTRHTVTDDVDLYAPPDFDVDPRDRVILPTGDVYEVNGHAEDFNHGPFGFAPGVRVRLERSAS